VTCWCSGLSAWDSVTAGSDLVEQLGNFTPEQLSSSTKQYGNQFLSEFFR